MVMIGSKVKDVSTPQYSSKTRSTRIRLHQTFHGELERRDQGDVFGRNPMPVWKRSIDIFGSVLGLVLLSPFFLLVGLFIKTVSKGPVFFKQERIGQGGRTFRMWKFRTYEVNSDTGRHQQYMSNLINAAQQGEDTSQSPMTELDQAPGIIPFGNVLRKTCIDELPQLFNVFKGDMSVVGPRPSHLGQHEQIRIRKEWGTDVMRPGLTSLAITRGRDDLSIKEKAEFDKQYVFESRLFIDIPILFKTVLIVLTGKGSN